MFKPEDELNAAEKEKLARMRFEVLPYSMAFLPISSRKDHVYLDAIFLNKEDFFDWHKKVYASVGIEHSENLHFLEPDEIYPDALINCKNGELVTTISLSHKLQSCVDLSRKIAISKKANSKKELPAQAAKAGFAIPKSGLFASEDLCLEKIQEHFDFPAHDLIMKADGLGGGVNVRTITSLSDCHEFAKDFARDEIFILQERLDFTKYDQYMADFVIRDNGIECVSTRLKLVAGNRWFCNIYSPRVLVNGQNLPDLIRCAENLRELGYSSETGFVCGIDFFQRNKEVLITDVNARWTGGLPAAILLEKLNLNEHLVTSHLDHILESDMAHYQKFVEKHLYCPESNAALERPGSFALLPLSFSAQARESMLAVWFLVIGDFLEFLNAKPDYELRDSLPLSDIVGNLVREKSSVVGYGGR